MYLKIFIYYFFSFIVISFNNASSSEKIPNITGTWIGENKTISEQRGFRTWEKKVEIIEQNGRRFKGTFSYTDGTKNFFGVMANLIEFFPTF